MIKHVLFCRLKDTSEESCQKLKDMFLSMKDEIDFIRDIEVGIDFVHADRSYDVCLALTLDSPEALDAYQIHPYHANVVKPYVHSVVRETNVACDYYI